MSQSTKRPTFAQRVDSLLIVLHDEARVRCFDHFDSCNHPAMPLRVARALATRHLTSKHGFSIPYA